MDMPRPRCPHCFREFSTKSNIARHIEKGKCSVLNFKDDLDEKTCPPAGHEIESEWDADASKQLIAEDQQYSNAIHNSGAEEDDKASYLDKAEEEEEDDYNSYLDEAEEKQDDDHSSYLDVSGADEQDGDNDGSDLDYPAVPSSERQQIEMEICELQQIAAKALLTSQMELR